MKEIIANIIKGLGISANLKGYYYIRFAITLAVNDFTYIDAIVKKLYPAVAKEYKTTASRVERAIRHAIITGWNRADVEFANKLFGYTVDINKSKPTNGEFISTVADYILITERETEK